MKKKVVSIVMIMLMCISINLFGYTVYGVQGKEMTAGKGGAGSTIAGDIAGDIVSEATSPTTNPNYYKPGNMQDSEKVKDMGNIIIGTIQIIGTILSVIVLVVLGIKYMMGSVEEKAEYKKSMTPYIIGAIMVFAITNVLGIIVGISNNLNSL